MNNIIPKASYVTIKVYNMLDKKVTTLVMEEKRAGNNNNELNANNLASGIYFYRVQADSFVETKKLILMK